MFFWGSWKLLLSLCWFYCFWCCCCKCCYSGPDCCYRSHPIRLWSINVHQRAPTAWCWVCVVVGWGLQSPFHVQPNCSFEVEVVLRCRWGSDNSVFSRGTRAQHLTLCGVWGLCVWCPLDGCDAPSGQRGKTTVQSQSVCKVHVYTQPWAQNRHE